MKNWNDSSKKIRVSPKFAVRGKMASSVRNWHTGVLCIIAWSTFWSLLTFGTLRWVNLLRVSDEVQKAGLDIEHHGQSAYNDQSKQPNFSVGNMKSDQVRVNAWICLISLVCPLQHTVRQGKLKRQKMFKRFEGCHKNTLIQSFEMSPHLICLECRSKTLLWPA